MIGVKPKLNGKNGTVYVRSTGRNQNGKTVLSFARWVMVNKRDLDAPAPEPVVPELAKNVVPESLGMALPPLKLKGLRLRASRLTAPLGGLRRRRQDRPRGRADNRRSRTPDGDAPLSEHCPCALQPTHGKPGPVRPGRLVYGGHIISIARSLSFNGLANAFHVLGMNGARHAAPSFFRRHDLRLERGARQSRAPGPLGCGCAAPAHVAVKDRACADFPGVKEDGSLEEGVVLDMDYWVALPR